MPAVNYEELARFYDALVTDDSDLPYFRDLARQADGPVAEFMAQEGSPYRSPKTASTSPASTRPRRCSRFCGRSWLQGGARAQVVCGDVTRVELGTQFTLIFIAFHSFEELASDTERQACLENILRHLHAGGRFVCTTHDVPSRLVAGEGFAQQRAHVVDTRRVSTIARSA